MEPDGPPRRVRLRVRVPEVEGKVGVRRLVGPDLARQGLRLRRRRGRSRRARRDPRERWIVVGVGEGRGGAQEAGGQGLGALVGAPPWEEKLARKKHFFFLLGWEREEEGRRMEEDVLGWASWLRLEDRAGLRGPHVGMVRSKYIF